MLIGLKMARSVSFFTLLTGDAKNEIMGPSRPSPYALRVKDIRACMSVENKLLLNDTKTKVIQISSRFKNHDPLAHVKIGSSKIESVVIDDSLQ